MNKRINKILLQTFGLSAIAITNHNIFDEENFNLIHDKLSHKVNVFPGMEISIDSFHAIIIFKNKRINLLNKLATYFKLNKKIEIIKLIDFLNESNPSEYMLIPHYEKGSRSIQNIQISLLNRYIKCGETRNKKRLNVLLKDGNSQLVPVLFSDFRALWDIGVPLPDSVNFINSFTYVKCDSNDFNVIKNALESKKVSSSSLDDLSKIEYLPDGSSITSGINVIVGARASGKSWTLDKIFHSFPPEDVKYIKQFDISKNAEDDKFIEKLQKKYQNDFSYLWNQFPNVINALSNIDINNEEKSIEQNLQTLKEYANMSSNLDAFASTKIYSDIKFDVGVNKGNELVKSIENLLSNDWHNELVYKYISLDNIKLLRNEIISLWKNEEKMRLLKSDINKLIKKIKGELSQQSAIPKLSDINLSKFFEHKKIVELNNKAFVDFKSSCILTKKSIDDYVITITRESYANATEIKKVFNAKSGTDIYNTYSKKTLFDYLKICKSLGFSNEQISKSIFKIVAKITNKCGENLSGGEKARFILMNAINDISNKDILLIDELEPAFDNPFLFNKIIPLLEQKAKQGKTICITTHNSILGVLLKSDRLIFCQVDSNGDHKTYFGEHGLKEFKTVTGEKIKSYRNIIEIMESGEEQFNEKGKKYENFRN